jgi:hypothetical protein
VLPARRRRLLASHARRSPSPCLALLLQRNAVSYFNFMSNEGRPVVAAMLPAGGAGEQQQGPQEVAAAAATAAADRAAA